MSIIKFENLVKNYKDNEVLKNINLEINEGEFITLIGPSGCGKTTTLKLINNLISKTSGNIYIMGKEIDTWNKIELRRHIGYVIQQIGLFPHMNIFDNIIYVLKITKNNTIDRIKKTSELIQLVGLDNTYLNKYPRELSGGEQQRVGVARALANDPSIILMDEPFGAIDEITRKSMQDELKKLYNELKKTIIFVTHDIQEAMKLGSRIILLKDGEIIQSSSKEEMFFNPNSDFVKDFFDDKNFMSYLGLINIKDGMKINTSCSKIEDKLFLNDDVTVMDAVNKAFKNGVNNLPVVNSENICIGEFHLDNIYKQLLLNNKPD